MIREIEFRGKNYAGEWVYGNLMQYANGDAEIWEIFNPDIDTDCRDWAVIPKTVGQYTGLKDKNGVKIFEGDITRHHRHGDTTCWVWHDRHICYVGKPFEGDISERYYYQKLDEPDLEVIGNIHDNPELFGGAGE